MGIRSEMNLMVALSKEQLERDAQNSSAGRLSIFLLYCAVFYNACLAFVNAHIVPIHSDQVALTEAIIVAMVGGYILTYFRLLHNELPFLAASLCIFASLFLWVLLPDERTFLKSLRDVILIFSFYVLGTQAVHKQILRAFRSITLIIVGTMIIEGWLPDVYVAIFQPAQYFAGTRDMPVSPWNYSGMFGNSLGFEGRVTYGLFGERRLSSVFLEQVSLANFAIVLSIFTMTLWPRLKQWDKSLFVAAIIFIIASTSSRTASAICPLMLVGYYFFPVLPKYSSHFVTPLVLLGGALLLYDPDAGLTGSDDIKGRIGDTFTRLASLDWTDWLT